MVSIEQIEVFDPYQYVHSEFLGSLDALTTRPLALPVVALLARHPDGLTLDQTRAWLTEAIDRSSDYHFRKLRTLTLHMAENGVVDMTLPRGPLNAKIALNPETADLNVSIAAAIGSWQLENSEVPWRNMLAKTVMTKHAATKASDAFGLLHIMTANEYCTGGDNVPGWESYHPVMTRLVKTGVAECAEVEEGINSYWLTESHQQPAADLVNTLHDAAACGIETRRFREFLYNEFDDEVVTPGMKFIVQKSLQKAYAT